MSSPPYTEPIQQVFPFFHYIFQFNNFHFGSFIIIIIIIIIIIMAIPCGMKHFSSLTRDQTCVPCIGGMESYHWITREVPVPFY